MGRNNKHYKSLVYKSYTDVQFMMNVLYKTKKINPQIFPPLVLAWADKHICQTPKYLHLFFFFSGRQIFWAPMWEARGRCWFSTADKAVKGQSGHRGHDLVCWSAINHAMQTNEIKRWKSCKEYQPLAQRSFLESLQRDQIPSRSFFKQLFKRRYPFAVHSWVYAVMSTHLVRAEYVLMGVYWCVMLKRFHIKHHTAMQAMRGNKKNKQKKTDSMNCSR